MYVAKTKALISFAVTANPAKLICAFVFAYAKCWFSLDAAHFTFSNNEKRYEYSIVMQRHFFSLSLRM